ncbi:slit homolog 2 protein-like [Paramacrobiotus metropolitanus]|uniref:slit homolog 2 protein-like n=1 Tax=Paramacrobiotus metropolitanus TaxID=2943436 RepID=UPI0024459C9A|nr:slit homolog 2 protein-like [Paramacrobiotus metropolitanus]
MTVFTLLLLLLRLDYWVDAGCSHLPSGACFVDCTRTDTNVYIVVCEAVDGNQLQTDLDLFAGLNVSFHLHLWNAPGIERLGGTSFLTVERLMIEMQMQNVENLQMFPEVKALKALKQITIQNAPKLLHFALELVPPSVERIDLHQTGIAEFYADYCLANQFPNMKRFRLSGQTFRLLDRYFTAFPNLEIIEVLDCHIDVGHLTTNPMPFLTIKPLKRLLISNNTFHSPDLNFYNAIFHHIVSGLIVDENSDIEISGNAFPIGKQGLKNFDRLAKVRRLSLRGSHFENYNTLENLFVNFRNLVDLDLGFTNLPVFKSGIFRGLPKLETLKIDGNNIRDTEDRELFEGLAANNFSNLDVSDNQLDGQIKGYENWAKNLLSFDLAGNGISKSLFVNRGKYFAKLRRVSQARNRRTQVASADYQVMKELEVLDFGCNEFRNITKGFFNKLPASLKTYNLSFCQRQESNRVIVAEDAFTEFPPIQELYIDGAFLRANIFKKLQKMSAKSAQALKTLHLARNKIAYLHGRGKYFTPFTELEYLDLHDNRLQSTGAEAFSPLKRLRQLNLANNGLFSIGTKDFIGLDSLEDLNLSGNRLLLISPGSFDMLPHLHALFLHDNNLPETVVPSDVFGDGKGRNLTHLSIGNLALRCLDPSLFTFFRNLKWIYLNDSIPLFVDMDPQLNVAQQLQNIRLHPWAGLQMCDDADDYDEPTDLEESFVRVSVSDPKQAVYQDLYLHFNDCFYPQSRNIKEKVRDTLCVN